MGPEEPQKCPTIDRVQISLPTGPGVLTLDRSSTGQDFSFPSLCSCLSQGHPVLTLVGSETMVGKLGKEEK